MVKCLFISNQIILLTCRTVKSRGLLSFSKHYSPAFVEEGFNNLKKALHKFRDHECSIMHQEAVIKLAATNTSTGIDVQLSTQLESEQKYHRHMLMKLLRTIKFLVVLCSSGKML